MNLLTVVTILTVITSFLNPSLAGLLHKVTITTPDKTVSQNIHCTDDLRLPSAMQKLKSKEAVSVLQQNCLLLFDNLSADLQGTGKNDLVFWAAGAGCDSCHEQQLYVLSGDKIIFHKDTDDPQIRIDTINGLNALVIRQPIRKDNEPLSDPNQWYETTYLWNSTIASFDKYNETTGFYTTPTPSPASLPLPTAVPTPDNKAALNACLKTADDAYTQGWANDCKSIATQAQQDYNNCTNNGTTGQDACDFGNRNYNPQCTLSVFQANYLENMRANAKTQCYNQYYAGN